MSDEPLRPLGRRIQARVMRAINVPMRVILGLRVATPLGRRLMLVSYVGRRTGKHYRQPLSYVRDGEALLTPGGGKWTLNLQAGKPVQMRLLGRDHQATPEIVTDAEQIDALLTRMTASNPMVGRFVAIPKSPDGHRDRMLLQRAIDHGFVIVRWRLDAPADKHSSMSRADSALP